MTDHATRARELAVKELVDKFLAWPLPASACADLCATKQGYPHRSGTTLLNANEAKQMVEHLFTDFIAAALDQAAQEAVKKMEQRKDAAYLERNQVVAALAKCFPSGKARTAIEGWSEDWHNCVYIDLPTGQVSWHYHDSQAYLFVGVPHYLSAWDGHSTEEKYRRLAALQAAQPVVKDEGCSMAARIDLGHGENGHCTIRNRPCPPRCLLKQIRHLEITVNSHAIAVDSMRTVYERQLQAAQKAVEAERERCAAVCENTELRFEVDWLRSATKIELSREVAHRLAAEIRQGKPLQAAQPVWSKENDEEETHG